MGTLADSLFTVLMGWVRALVSALWSLFSSDDMTVLGFLGKNWMMIAVVMIAAGLVIDWIIWLLRWQPYHLWAQRARRMLRIEEPEEEEEEVLRARPAVTKKRENVYKKPVQQQGMVFASDEDESDAMNRARSVPDRELGAYPGMLYDRENPQPTADLSRTQPFSVLSGGGPGAQEVSRRREEIDAYRRMQEEAAQRAREEAARRAEEERIARENAARSAEERAAQLAQEQYARELAEYERQKAQYERDLAEYERQKAEYDAQMAAQAAEQEAANREAAEWEAAQSAAAFASRRRRQSAVSYSEFAPQEDVDELPDPPAWPQMDAEKRPGILERVAKMMDDPEDGEIVGIHALPPRVDPHDAFKPAKTPERRDRRRH